MSAVTGTLKGRVSFVPRQVSPGIGDVKAVAPAFRLLTIAAVIGGLTFNFFLCFVNTRIMRISAGSVMLTEMLLIGMVLWVAFTRQLGLYLLLAVFLSYMLLLFALRGGQYDLKSVRDILIPVGFYFAGTRLKDLKLADRLVLISALIVVAAGLFEYLLLDTYISYFNVIGYYLARGSVTLDKLYGQTQGLFISGVRPEPRTILPFLGQHRVSSVFLEPVSMGNFAVIIYSWTLYRGRQFAARWWVLGLAFTVITLADARFGLYSCVLITLLYPLYHFVPRLVWATLPFLLLAALGIYGINSGTSGGANDISGRFADTAHILTQLSLSVVLGAEVTDQFTADSGIAYSLTAFGIVGFIALWTTFVYARAADPLAWRYHSMVIVYLLLLMMISDSFYSIKTAALLWFLLGSANGIPPVQEKQPRKSAELGVA